MKPRLVLLGGSGFIGQSLLRFQTLARGGRRLEMVIFDPRPPQFFQPGLFVQGEIEETEKIRETGERVRTEMAEREKNVTRRENELSNVIRQKEGNCAALKTEILVLQEKIKNYEDQGPALRTERARVVAADVEIVKLRGQACALKGTKCNFTEKK